MYNHTETRRIVAMCVIQLNDNRAARRDYCNTTDMFKQDE